MKRWMTFALSIWMIAALLPALAQDPLTEGPYTFVVSLGYAAITDYSGDDTDLVIPDTLGGYPVNRICKAAFQNSKTLVRVTVPQGVVSIGESVPDESGYVEPLVEYDSTRVIGFRCGTVPIRQAKERSVFAGCTSLTTIYLPDGVESFYKRAFYDCGAQLVMTPGSVTEAAWREANAPLPEKKPTRTPAHGQATPDPDDDFYFGG